MSSTIQNPAGEMVQPKPQQESSREAGELASLTDRFLAGLIDGAIVAVAASILVTPIMMSGMVPFLLMPLVAAALGFGIFAGVNYKLLSTRGQTVGKSLMKIKIVQSNGEQMDTQELLLKRYGVFWAANAIPYIGFLVAIANVCLVFRESRKAGHDEVADTKVVSCQE